MATQESEAAARSRTGDLMPELLVEHWLPIVELGVESQREHGYGTPFPAPFRLHIWWARRPLVASRSAILASLLPAWSSDWPNELRGRFPTEESYRQWFLRLLGIEGDPIEALKAVKRVRETGKFEPNIYGYARAFSVNPPEEELVVLLDLLELAWGTRNIAVLDSMAGGGSIPLEALRYGFTTYANELNPVASVILAASLDYPARFGTEFTDELRRWGREFIRRVRQRLDAYYYRSDDMPLFYLWARTVACPVTGKPVPLSPNWWLQKGEKPMAVRVLSRPDWNECRFEILRGPAALAAKPDQGTIRRGTAISPWTNEVIDGEYI